MTDNHKAASGLDHELDYSGVASEHQRGAWAVPMVKSVDVAALTMGAAGGPTDGITVES